MAPNSNRVRIWNAVFNILCILGCSYQLSNLFTEYLRYDSITKVKFYSPKYVSFSVLHFCFRYLDDAINWTGLEERYGNKYPHVTDEDEDNWLNIMTIKDIFDLTPNAEIGSCSYRSPPGHRVISHGEDDCSIFKLSKYVVQQYVCYVIETPGMKRKMEFKYIYSSLTMERMLFEFKYFGKLADATKIRPTLTLDQYPYLSNQYSPGYYLAKDEDSSLLISCSLFRNLFLGYPFDSFACSANISDYFLCFESCMKNMSMTHINRLPYSVHHREPIDAKLISRTLIKNDSVQEFLSDWSVKCRSSCPQRPCKYSYCLTSGHVDDVIKGTDGHRMGSSIRVETTTFPDVDVSYLAFMTLLDLFTYVSSSFGIWFGMVIITLNPVKLLSLSYLDIFNIFPSETGHENKISMESKRVDAVNTYIKELGDQRQKLIIRLDKQDYMINQLFRRLKYHEQQIPQIGK